MEATLDGYSFVGLTDCISSRCKICTSYAKERDITFWPFAALTLTLGSIGPLSYFAWREWRVWIDARSAAVEPSHQRA